MNCNSEGNGCQGIKPWVNWDFNYGITPFILKQLMVALLLDQIFIDLQVKYPIQFCQTYIQFLIWGIVLSLGHEKLWFTHHYRTWLHIAYYILLLYFHILQWGERNNKSMKKPWRHTAAVTICTRLYHSTSHHGHRKCLWGSMPSSRSIDC